MTRHGSLRPPSTADPPGVDVSRSAPFGGWVVMLALLPVAQITNRPSRSARTSEYSSAETDAEAGAEQAAEPVAEPVAAAAEDAEPAVAAERSADAAVAEAAGAAGEAGDEAADEAVGTAAVVSETVAEAVGAGAESEAAAASAAEAIAAAATVAAGKRHKRVLTGMVVSNGSQQSIVVSIARRKKHRLYKKYRTLTKKVMAHDPGNDCQVGDRSPFRHPPDDVFGGAGVRGHGGLERRDTRCAGYGAPTS